MFQPVYQPDERDIRMHPISYSVMRGTNADYTNPYAELVKGYKRLFSHYHSSSGRVEAEFGVYY